MSKTTDELWDETEEWIASGDSMLKDCAATVQKIITDNADPVMPNGARKPSKLGEFIRWFGHEYFIGLDDKNQNRIIYLKAIALHDEEQEHPDTIVSSETKMEQKPTANGLVEELADLEHRRWSGWQTWCHKILREHCPSEALEKVLARWDKQIATDYKDLSEREKEMDRKEARKSLEILSHYTPVKPADQQEDGLSGELTKVLCDDCHAVNCEGNCPGYQKNLGKIQDILARHPRKEQEAK